LITRITGRLLGLTEETATLECPPFEYQVLVPEFTRRHLQPLIGQTVVLETIHYLDGNPQKGGRMVPRLIGFATAIEKEFFDHFCQVDGVGAKKALRAMVRPVQDIARAIEQQDFRSVATLPGIGPAMSERIVAKLRRKMGKYALWVGGGEDGPAADVERNVVDDTWQILCTLGHSEADARRLLDAALKAKRKYKSVEELLQAVYDTSAGVEGGS
jgi:holliday junction DNA helicase RuvA